MTVLPPMVELVLRTSVIALAALITGLLWDLIGAGLAFGASREADQGHRYTSHGRRRDQPAEPPGATGDDPPPTGPAALGGVPPAIADAAEVSGRAGRRPVVGHLRRC